jgi:hypothetical protein
VNGGVRVCRLPESLVLNGELVAFNADGDPHFPLLTSVCKRLAVVG